MENPNILKIFIGSIAIIFMIAIFWLTSWNITLTKLKETDEHMIQLSFDIETIKKEKEEIPKLKAMLASLTHELNNTKSMMVTDIADTEKLVKKHKKLLQDYNKSKEKK